MIDPISTQGVRPVGGGGGAAGAAAKPSGGAATDFAAALKSQLAEVSEMQADANDSVQRLLTGESQNITEVFATARKAEVAFTLLMEIRNKLVDAYSELRQVRV